MEIVSIKSQADAELLDSSCSSDVESVSASWFRILQPDQLLEFRLSTSDPYYRLYQDAEGHFLLHLLSDPSWVEQWTAGTGNEPRLPTKYEPDVYFQRLVSVLADECFLRPGMSLVRAPIRLCSTVDFLACGVLGHVALSTKFSELKRNDKTLKEYETTVMCYQSFPSLSVQFLPLLTRLLERDAQDPPKVEDIPQAAFLSTLACFWEDECNFRYKQQYSPMQWSRRSSELLTQWQQNDVRKSHSPS